jgi:tetratricopeptide (TPR) repeat protein
MATVAAMAHFLAPPFDLPGGRDERLVRHLEDDDWAAAITLLRDVVTPDTTTWKWLVLLAYVRFRDASDIVPDELVDASREALSLLDRGMQHGAPLDQVAPFREAVEATLDQLSRGEEALLAKLGPGDDPKDLTDEELESVCFVLDRHDPARAVKLFAALAERNGPLAVAWKVRAALALARSGEFEKAKPALEDALAQDWSKPPLSGERLALEGAEATLLEHATGAEFLALWHLAEERGARVAFPFPSAWPHQERLFERCVALRDFTRARALAQRIENERTELSEALAERLKVVRLEQV